MLLGRDTTATLQTVELGSHLSKGRVEAILAGDGVPASSCRASTSRTATSIWIATRCKIIVRPAATSDLLFKGVLTDKARSVFSGLIRVLPEGKKTAAYQQNRNLLLSRTARADSIPNLEIGANDIIGCSHGATVGKVDEEQLFYLMSAVSTRLDATQLIVEGFVDPLVAEVPIAGLRDALRREIRRACGERGDRLRVALHSRIRQSSILPVFSRSSSAMAIVEMWSGGAILPAGSVGVRHRWPMTPIAVFNCHGEFFAIGDTCTHEEFALSEGEVYDDARSSARCTARGSICARARRFHCLPPVSGQLRGLGRGWRYQARCAIEARILPIIPEAPGDNPGASLYLGGGE